MTEPKPSSPPEGASPILSPEDVASIGADVYGTDAWAAPLAIDVGVSRSAAYRYGQVGASGAQAAAIIGLLARHLQHEHEAESARQAEHAEWRAGWMADLREFEARLTGTQGCEEPGEAD